MATEDSTLIPNPEFAVGASEDRLERAAKNLRDHGIDVEIVATAVEALEAAMRLIPPHAEVLTSTSKTLETIGLVERLSKPGEFDLVRPKFMALTQAKDVRGARKLGAAPDVEVGSVHAVTEEGEVLIASATGSQLGPYASGAETVIWIVGAQKVVADLSTGLRRIREYAYPLEDERARGAYGKPSSMAKILIVARENRPGRIHLILVKEKLGF
ncbi:MAG: LUD domain-containing protein [Thermoplasmata archaeon]